MRFRTFLTGLVLLPVCLFGQDPPASVASLVQSVSLDSLLRYVDELSGHRPIYVGDSVRVVYVDSTDRTDTVWVANQWVNLPNRQEKCNDAATSYLYSRLRAFGYDSVVVDTYYQRPWTHNVVAYKPATVPGGATWLIGAHYDSVLRAPGADDNASGTAVTLEAARILSNVPTAASIIFGLWDSEEAGLFGSDLFAARAYDDALRIDGVLNFDMVAWDGDKDRVIEIHADETARSIGGLLSSVATRYNLGLNPYLAVPGTGRSDHMSFRKWGYPAVKVIEEEEDDFNPFYHSAGDVVEHFDTGYFHEVAKLAVAALGELALPATSVLVQTEMKGGESFSLDAVYPNPVSSVLSFSYRMGSRQEAEVRIVSPLGREVARFAVFGSGGEKRTSRWSIPFDLPEGVYFIRLESGVAKGARPFVVAR